MTAGVGLVISKAFTKSHLHRLEANIQPGNVRSIALVKCLGFRLEGLSRRGTSDSGAHDGNALVENQNCPSAANTVAWWAPQIRAGDEVRWPYAAVETAPIAERDIAAVAVRALSETSLAGADFVLTGPAALSHARQVAVIGEVLGRRLAFYELTPDDFRRETAASWPRPVIDMLLAAWEAAVWHPAYVSTTVADLTRPPARSFRDWVAAHADSVGTRAGRGRAARQARRPTPPCSGQGSDARLGFPFSHSRPTGR